MAAGSDASRGRPRRLRWANTTSGPGPSAQCKWSPVGFQVPGHPGTEGKGMGSESEDPALGGWGTVRVTLPGRRCQRAVCNSGGGALSPYIRSCRAPSCSILLGRGSSGRRVVPTCKELWPAGMVLGPGHRQQRRSQWTLLSDLSGFQGIPGASAQKGFLEAGSHWIRPGAPRAFGIF